MFQKLCMKEKLYCIKIKIQQAVGHAWHVRTACLSFYVSVKKLSEAGSVDIENKMDALLFYREKGSSTDKC